MFFDAVGGIGGLDVGGLDELPDAAQPPLDLLQLRLDGLQLLALLAGDPVHLFVHQLHQVADVGLGQHVLPQLADYQLLEGLGVEPGGLAGPLALLQQGVADVVGVPAALGFGGGHGLAAGLALGQAAEQVGAGGAAGVHLLRSAGLHHPGDALELLFGDDGGEGVLDPHGLGLVPGLGSPDQGAGVSLVGEHGVDGGLEPALAVGGGDALGVEGLHDVQVAAALEGQVEDAPGHGVGGRVQLQPGALLGPVLDVDLLVAVGRVGGDPEAARGGFAHPPDNLLGQIFAIELVHALDDGLHQLAGGGVVGVLGDGDEADTPLAEHGLEGDGVLPFAGEAREFPDQNLLERGLGPARLVQHPPELGPVGDAPALGLVHELADHQVAVLVGVVAQGPHLGGHGEVHVLALAGHPGVEGRRHQVIASKLKPR